MPPPKKKPAAKPPASAPEADLSNTAATLSRLRAKWPPLAADTRRAFRALATDEQRSKLGKQTKAEGVLREGVRWAVQIDEQLRVHPDATEHYKAPRFAYFLERLQALHERLALERAKSAERKSKRATALSERDIAIHARKRLARRLETFAGRRDAERQAIAAAFGTLDTDENLCLSIVALGKLAKTWAARTDADSKLQAENADLTQANIDKALAAGKALAGAGADATLEGRAAAKDSPLVNRDEGDVLLEMEEAMSLFEDAHEDNDAVKKLVPGTATRHVLGTRKATKEDKEPEPEPTEGPKVGP